MLNNHYLKLITIATTCLFLSNCATNSKNSGAKSGGRIVPATQKFTLPGGNSSNWRYLGTTDDNLIANEISDSSIESSGKQTYKYQDRKTIVDVNSFEYLPNQPKYKFALGSWLMDCSSKQYLILKISIYDKLGNLIKNYDYTNNDSVKWLQFGEGSLANIQYNYICLNVNRNLGY
jgi:hypothetical protein